MKIYVTRPSRKELGLRRVCLKVNASSWGRPGHLGRPGPGEGSWGHSHRPRLPGSPQGSGYPIPGAGSASFWPSCSSPGLPYRHGLLRQVCPGLSPGKGSLCIEPPGGATAPEGTAHLVTSSRQLCRTAKPPPRNHVQSGSHEGLWTWRERSTSYKVSLSL